MSNAVKNAQAFLQKAAQPAREFKEGFESLGPIQMPTIAMPIMGELTEKEELAIKEMLIGDLSPEEIAEKSIESDIKKLTNITKEIKNISSQSILLHGERIEKAQELLKDYKEGVFTKWLISTYGNRQTPYSMLRYYEFHKRAPQETRRLIEAAPKKAIYMLASRDGDQDKKLELIEQYGASPQAELLSIIQDSFPVAKTDKRRPLGLTTINAMKKLCLKLEKDTEYISEENQVEIDEIIRRLQKIKSLHDTYNLKSNSSTM